MTSLREFMTVSLSCLLLALTPSVALSYEADMHYGLVKWLAYKAGFSLRDAEIIATGSQSADESNVLDATQIMIRTGCRSVEASRHVQQHHFPSGGYVPSPPHERFVVPGHHHGESTENRWVRQEIYVPATVIDRRTRLDRFGASLHPLADSWAHQGKPDTVLACPDDLFWGHPAARGGISLPYGKHNHDADLTYLFPADATAAAESMYKFMGLFLKENRQFRAHGTSDWNDLSRDIPDFVNAKLAYERNNGSTKQAWFEKHPEVWGTYTTYPCFLESLTLDGHRKADCSSGTGQKSNDEAPVSTGSLPSIDNSVPEDVRGVVDDFLTTWIIEKDLEDAVDDFMDKDEIAANLAAPVFRNFELAREPFLNREYVDEIKQALGKAASDPDDWMRAILGMWFAQDHGTVNKLGHGMPNNTGFQTLAAGDFEQKFGFNSLTEAIHIPGQQNTYLLVPMEPSDRGERYLASFAFRDAPRDAIMLIIERIDGDWKISGFFWTIT